MGPSVQTDHLDLEESIFSWVKRLQEAAETGLVLDLAPTLSDQELRAADPLSWPYEQRIPAPAIRRVLLRENLRVDPKGFQIRGCYVTGRLDLDYATLRHRIRISHSHFADTPTFVHAAASEIDFTQSTIPGLDLEFVAVSGNVVLEGIRSTGCVFAKNSHVGGQFNLSSARITASGDALALQGAVVKGSVLLPRLRSSGRIVAINAAFGARLVLSGACIGESKGYSLLLRNSSVAGIVHMDQMDLSGTLHAYGTEFGADFLMEFAMIRSLSGDALVLDNATIAKNASVRDSVLHGTLRAHSARIGGQLELRRTRISSSSSSPSHLGILLTHASVNTGALLQDIRLRGCLVAYGAKFGGDLLLERAHLVAPQREVLVLDGATVKGNTRLVSVDVEGSVVASGADFSGLFDLSNAVIRNRGGIALYLGLTKVGLEGLFWNLRSEGTVVLYGAQFEKNVGFAGAKIWSPYSYIEADSPDCFAEPEADSHYDDALVLTRANFGGTLDLSSVALSGVLVGINCRFGSQLNLENARVSNPARTAINFAHARVGNVAHLSGLVVDGDFIGRGWTVTDSLQLDHVAIQSIDLRSSSVGQLLLTETENFQGPIHLQGSFIGLLEVATRKPAHPLPPLADARGWKIESVSGYLGADRQAVMKWLATVPSTVDLHGRESFAPQPWKEMARSLESMGHLEDARWLRFKAAEKTTQASSQLAKPWRLLLAAFVGYGYYPWFVVPWLISLFVATLSLACAFAYDFTPTDSKAATVTYASSQGQVTARVSGTTFPRPPNYPEFNAALFAVDTALPAAVTGQSAAWRVTENQWLPAVFAAIKAFAWILTALLLAGVTGVLRKD